VKSATTIGIQCALLVSTTLAKANEYKQINVDTIVSPVCIYLSFDDGPCESSYKLDSLAKADSVKINVFLVGMNVWGSETGRQLYNHYKLNPYIEIGNHSFYHAKKKYKQFYSNPNGVVDDILRNEDSLQLTNKLARLPGRNVWRWLGRSRTDFPDAAAAADSLKVLGYRIAGWDLEWQFDSTTKTYFTAEQMSAEVTKKSKGKRAFTSGHVVILCHDPMLRDPQFIIQLDLFVREMKKRNNCFAGFSNYGDATSAFAY